MMGCYAASSYSLRISQIKVEKLCSNKISADNSLHCLFRLYWLAYSAMTKLYRTLICILLLICFAATPAAGQSVSQSREGGRSNDEVNNDRGERRDVTIRYAAKLLVQGNYYQTNLKRW